MGNSDHGGLGDAGDGIDDDFDLPRIDVQAPRDHEVLAAADDRQITVLVDHAEIARVEVAVLGESAPGIPRASPIADEDVRAADLDVADGARRKRVAPIVDDPELDTGERHADGS